MELPSKIQTETESLKNAIGVKSGQVTGTVSMAIVALGIAISKGWQLFLATLAIAPVWFVACMFLAKITIAGFIGTTMAYN